MCPDSERVSNTGMMENSQIASAFLKPAKKGGSPGPRAQNQGPGPNFFFWGPGHPGAPKGGGEAAGAFLRGGAFIYVGAGSNGGLATPFVPDSAFSGLF